MLSHRTGLAINGLGIKDSADVQGQQSMVWGHCSRLQCEYSRKSEAIAGCNSVIASMYRNINGFGTQTLGIDGGRDGTH